MYRECLVNAFFNPKMSRTVDASQYCITAPISSLLEMLTRPEPLYPAVFHQLAISIQL